MLKIIITTFLLVFTSLSAMNPTDVLDYWFGPITQPTDYPREKAKIWFNGGAAVDKEITQRFGPLVLQAARGDLAQWKLTARGRLALIILLDQFPRNIYRGTAQSFAHDKIALALTLEGLEKGDDLRLLPAERSFFYLPLEHSEEMSMQELSVTKFAQLYKEGPEQLKPALQSSYQYAVRHRDIIAAYGRFPHRNKILQRPSTPAEEQFLTQPGSSF